MKPNFALSLSFDGLRLMHRVADGWHLVGQVALDDADLTGALDRLRTAADGLEAGEITTKLLIPNDQIKYIAIDGTRADVDTIREALHGATPYGVDDLVFDYAKGGGRTYVAAVAKDTLTEAQQFAAEHGFNPVSFAAVPEPFTYVGEAFFGAVDGHSVDRDAESVVLIGNADVVIPEAEAAPVQDPEAASEPDTATKDTPVHEAAPEPEAAEPAIDEDVAAEPVVEDAVETPEVSAAPEQDAPSPEVEPVGEPEIAPEIEPDIAPETESAPETGDVTLPELEVETEPKPAADLPELSMPGPDAASDEAPVFASRLRADRNEGRPAPVVEDKTPEATSGRTEPTLSRPAAPSLAVPTGQGTDPMPPLSAPSRDAQATPVAQQISTKAPDADTAPAITGEAPTALSPDAAVSAASLTVEQDLPDETSDADVEETAPRGAAAVVGGMFASRRMARAEAKAAAAQKAETQDTKDGPAEKSRLTVFGARKPPKTKPKIVVGGKPRFLGLILTAILLLFLLAFAAFAALSEEGIASWFGFGSDETQIAADPAAPEVAAPEGGETGELAALGTTDALAAPTAPAGGQVLTPEEATRIYAATGVWQRAPRIPLIPRTTTLDTMTLAVSSRPVVRVPASPLASASSVAGDALIATPIDPPPPGQLFNFGADGLVVATAQGAVTPDGILVIVGRPVLNPPTRPGTVAPEITPQDQLAAVIPEAATPLSDAPEGVIIIAGRPSIEPPVRTGTSVPAPAPEAVALASGDAPLVARDGLLVLAGSPPVLPPVRPGTTAPSAEAVTPEVTALEPTTAEPATPETPAPEGLNVIAGSPSVLPPVRPGTTAPSAVAATTPEIATPDANAPEGLNVIAGQPPVLPPARPGTQAPQAAVDNLTQDVAAALTTSTAQPATADTPRPLTRPASIVQAAAAAAEAAQAVELATSETAGFRPRTRPAGLAPAPVEVPDPVIEEAAVAETAPAAPTGLLIAPEIAAAVAAAANRPNPIVNPTRQAVPVSSRPDTRPRNMARIVARANEAQERAAAQAATQAAAVAPRAVAPSGPTGGSVAQAATLESAINLREVNLIGIYGGSNDRRALVRLGNGRYLRVTVGDRLDGGRVTAISAEALSYTKRGRSITLDVPG